MSKLTRIAGVALLLLQLGCAKTNPGISSGSNWLTCESLGDCDDDRAVSCSENGYCLDAEGDRIEHEIETPSASNDGDVKLASSRDAEPELSGNQDAGSAASEEPEPSANQDAGPDPRVRAASGSDATAECDAPDARTPLVEREGETCYDFAVHGESSPTDDSPFIIPQSETYNQFTYAVPWGADTVATAYGVDDDAELSVHAWLFATSGPGEPGMVQAQVTGSLLGQDARLLGAWAIGGCNLVLPTDIGLELPGTGQLLVQWHHLNETGAERGDRSAFRVCTAPASSRERQASITMLGTENLDGVVGAPPGPSTYSGSCSNDSGAPLTVFMLDPHMHKLGTRSTMVIERAVGDSEIAFDEPFRFDERQNYLLDPPIVLEPGDSLRTTCSFENTTGGNVAFGTSAFSEMCYQFAISFPPRALENGVLSLIGAANTCW